MITAIAARRRELASLPQREERHLPKMALGSTIGCHGRGMNVEIKIIFEWLFGGCMGHGLVPKKELLCRPFNIRGQV